MLLDVSGFSILGFFCIQDDLFQFVFGIDALPVAADGPDGAINENRPILSQNSCAVGFDLISDSGTIETSTASPAALTSKTPGPQPGSPVMRCSVLF
jgi:hypothetical protein